MVDELQCIKQHQQKHGMLVRVLEAGWLRQCGGARAHEDEAAWLFNPASALAAGPRKSREGSDLLDNREGSRAGFQGASDCDGAHPDPDKSVWFLTCWERTLYGMEQPPLVPGGAVRDPWGAWCLPRTGQSFLPSRKLRSLRIQSWALGA